MAQRSKSSHFTESQVECNGDIQPAESIGLRFLTFTNIDQTTDLKTKTKVRSHVMRRERLLRSLKRKEKDGSPADASSLSLASAGPSRDATMSMLGLLTGPNPCDLGAGRSDPFARYPIDMNVRTHELYDHWYAKNCPLLMTLCKLGFFTLVLDDAAFRQVLSISASHISRLRGGLDTAEAIVLSSKAIRSVNGRIADPVQCISDGVLVTIITFTMQAVFIGDYPGILTHFNGLEEVIRRRGGVQALSSNPIMLMSLVWVDIHAAFLLDRAPRFAIPSDILSRSTTYAKSLMSLQNLTLLEGCVDDTLVSAINELLVLNQFILSELARRDLWDDHLFAGIQVLPLLGKLLSIRYEISERNPQLARQESCRIGAILYLDGIRRRCNCILVTKVYSPKLKYAILAQEYSNLEKTDPSLLWILVVGGVQSLMHSDHQWFVFATANLIVRWRINRWEELMDIVRRVLWIDEIFNAECDMFHRELSLESRNAFGHTFS